MPEVLTIGGYAVHVSEEAPKPKKAATRKAAGAKKKTATKGKVKKK